jgi:hypothetical protein
MSEAIGSACTSGCDPRLERRAELDQAYRQRQDQTREADLEAHRMQDANREQAVVPGGSLTAEAVRATRASDAARKDQPDHPDRSHTGTLLDITV